MPTINVLTTPPKANSHPVIDAIRSHVSTSDSDSEISSIPTSPGFSTDDEDWGQLSTFIEDVMGEEVKQIPQKRSNGGDEDGGQRVLPRQVIRNRATNGSTSKPPFPVLNTTAQESSGFILRDDPAKMSVAEILKSLDPEAGRAGPNTPGFHAGATLSTVSSTDYFKHVIPQKGSRKKSGKVVETIETSLPAPGVEARRTRITEDEADMDDAKLVMDLEAEASSPRTPTKHHDESMSDLNFASPKGPLSEAQITNVLRQRGIALKLADLRKARATRLQNGLNAERTAHLATITELRNNSRVQHTGVDPEIISNLAASLACGEQEPQQVAAGLLDEVDRARLWDPARDQKTASGSLRVRDVPQAESARQAVAVPVDTTQGFNLWGFPDVPATPPAPAYNPMAQPARYTSSWATAPIRPKKEEDDWCAAHPMNRLKALEGVMDIALARITELELKLAEKETSRKAVASSSMSVYDDDEKMGSWGR